MSLVTNLVMKKILFHVLDSFMNDESGIPGSTGDEDLFLSLECLEVTFGERIFQTFIQQHHLTLGLFSCSDEHFDAVLVLFPGDEILFRK